jgi:hypothetical protein
MAPVWRDRKPRIEIECLSCGKRRKVDATQAANGACPKCGYEGWKIPEPFMSLDRQRR